MGITSKFKSESFDWYNKTKERTHRDIPLNWMSNLNSHTWVEQHPDRCKTTPFLEYSPDTKLNFQKISKVLPKYWRWHNETIDYYLNNEGFRNNVNFDEVDWENSYVILGCSNVVGVGVPFEETIGYYIEQKLKTPVINMASAGGSCQTVFNNFMKMVTDYTVPKGCFILWPEPVRQLDDLHYLKHPEFDDDWRRTDIHPANIKDYHIHDAKPFYQRNLIWKTVRHIMANKQLSEILHPDIPMPDWDPLVPGTSIFGGSWEDLAEDLKEKYLNEYIARDITYYDPKRGPENAHRGRKINQTIADYFIKGLK